MSTKYNDRLAIEITLVLCLKILLLWLLWFAFFSDPLDERLTGEQIGQILFSSSNEFTITQKEVK